jgi:hypothetical protein
MSSYYAFEFSTDTNVAGIENEVKTLVGQDYSVWLSEGKLHGFGKWEGMDWFCNVGYCCSVIDEKEKQTIRNVVRYLQGVARGNRVRFWPSTARDVGGLLESPVSIDAEALFNKYRPSMAYNLPCYLINYSKCD